MASPLLLESETLDGLSVYIAEDERSLTRTGSDSVMSTYHKELLAKLGFFEDGDLLETDVDQVYRFHPERRFLEVIEEIELPEEADADPLEVLEESEPLAPTADQHNFQITII